MRICVTASGWRAPEPTITSPRRLPCSAIAARSSSASSSWKLAPTIADMVVGMTSWRMMSCGSAKKTGPCRPESAVCTARRTTDDALRGLVTVFTYFAIGRTRPTRSSASLVLRGAVLDASWAMSPASTMTGRPSAKALARPVTAFVTPAPELTRTTGIWPCWAAPPAMNIAADSWRLWMRVTSGASRSAS